jgi:hypothetical protein
MKSTTSKSRPIFLLVLGNKTRSCIIWNLDVGRPCEGPYLGGSFSSICLICKNGGQGDARGQIAAGVVSIPTVMQSSASTACAIIGDWAMASIPGDVDAQSRTNFVRQNSVLLESRASSLVNQLQPSSKLPNPYPITL